MRVAYAAGCMLVNGSEPVASMVAPRTPAPRYCPHDGAREIRMYMSYGEANAVRLRLMLAGEPRWRHVSSIYQIAHGWAWTICNDCPDDDRSEAAAG